MSINTERASPPGEAKVVVIGAGLSGMVVATELVTAGVNEVVVLEARDYVGGRLKTFVRENGTTLEEGGEFTGPDNVELHKLAESLGIPVEPVPAMTQRGGKFVRFVDGERVLEDFPMQNDPEGAAAFAVASEELDRLASEVPPLEPWTATRATEWDALTIGQWLDANVSSAAAREGIAGMFASHGGLYETSFLFALWMLSRFGGVAGSHAIGERFVGGAGQIPRRLAASIPDKVFTSTPVRLIERRGDGVVVHHDRGQLSADVAVLALEPGQAGKIEFVPPLPAARARMQEQWLAGHGGKYFAIYERPFWRPDFAGVAAAKPPFGIIMDLSPADESEGILMLLYFEGTDSVDQASSILWNPDAVRIEALDSLVAAFGEEAGNPKEFHAFDWSGDRWAQGCGTQLPPGVLSRLGQHLRPPIGRLVFAGADSGARDWMDGAVTSGQRAGREALSLIG